MKLQKFIFFLVLHIVTFFILLGCEFSNINQQSTQNVTPLPSIIHYTPSENWSIQLEFDYQSSWILDQKKYGTGIIVISLRDSRFRDLATPIDFHPVANDYGKISIFIYPLKSDQTVDSETEMIKKGYSEVSWINILNDYKIKINEYGARVLEYQTNDLESSPSLMFNRRIIFIVKNQLYTILLTLAEKDRGTKFEQDYEHFFNSIKIIP